MEAMSLEDRVAALEAKVGSKSVEQQFMEQAGLIDRLFAQRFAEFDEKWDAKLEAKLETKLEAKLESKLEAKLEAKLDAKLDAKLEPIRKTLKVILARLP
jgi:hypothetical protein